MPFFPDLAPLTIFYLRNLKLPLNEIITKEFQKLRSSRM